MRRLIITTDAVDCLDVVDNGVNGFLYQVRDVHDLAKNGGAWPSPWQSLVSTHRMCIAAIRSLETGKMVNVDTTRL